VLDLVPAALTPRWFFFSNDEDVTVSIRASFMLELLFSFFKYLHSGLSVLT